MKRFFQTHSVWGTLISLMMCLMFCVLLPGCSDDMPSMATDEISQTQTQSCNSLFRTTEEAIEIAEDAYMNFYGSHSSQSRSALSIIDYGQPVEVISRPSSRNNAVTDTLLYVVNFVNDGGFAIIAANRMLQPLMAITEAGSYHSNDGIEIPGFQLWLDNTVRYVSDSAQHLNNFPPPIPLFPKDSLDIKLQVKEWNDTIAQSVISPQVSCNWGQGNGNISNILMDKCEGYFFENGLCGCATIAIAQICATFKYPNMLNEMYPGVGTRYQFDWALMSKHKQGYVVNLNGIDSEGAKCAESSADKAKTHEMIARLCRIIGNYGHAEENVEGTGMPMSQIGVACAHIFGHENVSDSWTDLNISKVCVPDVIYLVVGKSQFEGQSSHAWLCDGSRYYEFIHYLATRYYDYQEWKIQSSQYGSTYFHHYNWGWYGYKNGWFLNTTPVLGQNLGYHQLQYIEIRKPY